MAEGDKEGTILSGAGYTHRDIEDFKPKAPTRRSGAEDVIQIQKRILEVQEQQLGFQVQEVQLLRRGYHGFVQAEKVRAKVNPEQFDQLLPPWFEELDNDERGIIRTRLNINYLASIKRDTAMVSLDTWVEVQGLRVERQNLDNMWRKMPGFRVAMATMVNDIFDQNSDHLVISGEEGNGKIKATEGYAIIKDPKDFQRYKEELVGKIEKYLAPRSEELQRKYKVSLNELATAAVSAADNILFAGGAYDSGDEKRAIVPGSSDIYSEQVRAFFMPGVKGRVKWLMAGEGFGGPMGEWIRSNAAAGRGDFYRQVETEELKIIPKRFFYSLFDFVDFKKKNYRWDGKTFAQALLSEGKTPIVGTEGLVDFKDGGEGIDLNALKPDELIGYYADKRSDALQLYQHLISDDPKKRLERGKLLTELSKLRGEGKRTLLDDIFRDPELVEAMIIMTISPEQGLMRGIPEMLLNISPPNYDSLVNHALSDNRLFEGVDGMSPKEFRRKLFKDLNAVDLQNTTREILSYIPILGDLASPDVLIGKRSKLRRKAAANIKAEIRKA